MAISSEGTRLTDRKRAAIVEAAVSEFQRYGFDGTSMERIAATAGTSKRTVYNHFSSKEDLFEAIVNELLQASSRVENFPYNPDVSLEKQLQTIGTAFVDLMTSESFMKLARAVVSRFIHTPEIAAATMREQDKFDEGFVRWIQAANKSGRLKVNNPKRAAKQFSGLICEFVFWPQLIGSKKPLTKRELNQVIKSSVAMFLDHYASE